ncbi:MAG: hypothetical protein ACJA1L_001541 [Paracoccaceae bacterium]|jgi:hypothetical protein
MPTLTYDRAAAMQAIGVAGGGSIHEHRKVIDSMLAGTAGPMAPAAAIADLTVSASGTEISVAVNAVIAVLVAAGLVTAA